jgi:L-fuconolactonase
VPWPETTDTVLYRPALPARYGALAKSEGVLAAIAVECSPLASDNDWLLSTAAGNDLIVGVIGDLDPAHESFSTELDRLSANPIFRGIRYGNLWNRDLGQQISNPIFIANLRLLARHNLVLESANPTPQLVADLLRLATKIPDLRIVIDHLPQAVPPDDRILRNQYLATLKQLSERPNLFVKGSEIPRRIKGVVPLTLSTYTPWLDTLWQLFGEDRLFFGSDWPNSDHLTSLGDVFTLARGYLNTHGATASKKFFWSNSIAVYGWKPRNKAQQRALDHNG